MRSNGDHLQHLDVEDDLLEGGGEPTPHPAGGVADQVGATHNGRPQRHPRLVGGLGVDRVARVTLLARKGTRYRRASCPGDVSLPGVLGRAEGGRAGAHVDVRGEAALHDGRTGPDELVSVMPASASAFCWTRAPASVTGAIAPISVNGVIDAAGRAGHRNQPFAHRLVERRGEFTEMIGEDGRLVHQPLERDTERDRHHLHPSMGVPSER